MIPRRAFTNFIPFNGERLTRLPSWMEWYRPVLDLGQGCIETIHASMGTPWWVSIGCLTVVIRSMIVPTAVAQMKELAPMARAMPDFKLQHELYKESQAKRKIFLLASSLRTTAHYHGMTPWKAGAYGLIQVPHFLTYVWSIRQLCVKNDDLKEGGISWFLDLTQPDPYMILPITAVVLTYANLQRGVSKENADWFINRIRGAFQIALIMSLPLTVQWPSVSFNQGIFCY